MDADRPGPAAPERLLAIVDRFAALRVAVLGDAMLDRWISGSVERISPEAPVPVVLEGTAVEGPGGAANVARTTAGLGAATTLVGLVGTDGEAASLRALLAAAGVEARLVEEAARPTTRKVRVGDGRRPVVRLDRETTVPAAGVVAERLAAEARAAAAAADVVVVSDYAKGACVPAVLAALFGAGPPALVDPKSPDPSAYRGARWLSPNRAEAERWLGRKLSGAADWKAAADLGRARTGAAAVFLTLGAEGIFVSAGEHGETRSAARARAVFDVTGAGDACAAALALSLAAGGTAPEAAEIANAAAGIVVGAPGTAAVPPADLRRALAGERRRGAVVPRESLPRLLAAHRLRGERVVFTNGCFDVLHAGHVALLARCRAEGDVVVVGVNSDDSVRRLKGAGRPAVPEADRCAVLAALAAVDYVTLFAEDTPERLVGEVRPDVLVKGEDWKDKGVVGRETVEAAGGRVVLAPLVPGRSSSEILGRIAGDMILPPGASR
ncbi:MAG: PfkB family carbohydrate kinase [Planctomycetales bacterium]|nr:PfkB family carbohydrate kinase [Planctomycetales bacterium]